MKSYVSLLVVTGICVIALVTSLQAQASNKKEYAFRGVVEKVDARAQKLTVNGEKVEGWMQAMTMDYKVDRAEVLKELKAGDQITARVFDGDFMTLYDVQRLGPADKPEEKK